VQSVTSSLNRLPTSMPLQGIVGMLLSTLLTCKATLMKSTVVAEHASKKAGYSVHMKRQ